MAAGRKIKKKLEGRIVRWDAMKAQGNIGNTKMIDGYAFHKPGSQNRRQGN